MDRATLSLVTAPRWHTWSQEGVNYETRPKNAKEAAPHAASRRRPWPHTISQVRSLPEIAPPRRPPPLYLRRYPTQSRG